MTISAQTIQPTEVLLPTDLGFARPLVELLRNSGLTILSVQGSAYMSMFQSTDKAVWIKTDKGIVEAVVFVASTEAKQIRVSPLTSEAGRYIYKIQAPSPTLSHDVTIDAAVPLYFTVQHGMFVVTSSAELDEILKRILSEQ